MNFKKFLAASLAILLCACVHSSNAWPYPPAGGISVTTNSFSHLVGSNVQSVLDWLDDNAVLSSAGFVTESYLSTYYGSTSTNTFGQLYVVNGPTNAVYRVGTFYGFVATLTNATVDTTVTNLTLYGAITNIGSATYNPQGWYDAATWKFTPKVEGYYRLGAQVTGTDTCLVRIVSFDSNQIVTVGTTLGTNQSINGSGIVYANGTVTNAFFLEGLCLGGAPSSVLKRVVFQGEYLGK